MAGGRAMTEWRRPSARHVATLLAEHIIDLCGELLPRGQRRGGIWYAGNIAGEPGTSLHVTLTGRWRGGWRDWASDESGDVLDLVQAVRGFATRDEAVDWAIDWLAHYPSGPNDIASDRPAYGTTESTDEQRRHVEVAHRIWCDAHPAIGTPVERYLRTRGITINVPPSIRYAPSLWHGPTRSCFPAMIAGVQDVDGNVIGVHRTYLAPDGCGKAPVSPEKMMLGRCTGGAVRLGPPGPLLAVAEGIETAISIAQACPHLRVWAALSTSGLRTLILPPGVDEVILCPDGDEPGEQAARIAAKGFLYDGFKVQIARPPEGADFNDILVDSRAVEAVA